MKYHIFLQARVNSSRFPKKILKKIFEKTVFELLVERLRLIDDSRIFLVTGPNSLNRELINEAIKLDIEYFSGSEINVLDRFYHAAEKFSSKNIIRITGDCPLTSFELINQAKEIFYDKQVDILSNNYMPRTYPHGFDFEIFKIDALKRSWNIMKKEKEEKFFSTFINPVMHILQSNNFKHYKMRNNIDQSHIRLTLDYQEDFLLIKSIFDRLYKKNHVFTSNEIIALLKNESKLLDINKKFII